MTGADSDAAPVEGLVLPTERGGQPRLRGSRCLGCGEVFFPPREICSNCFGREAERFDFGPEGRLYSFTVVRDPPMLPPRPVGQVEFDGKVRVQGALLCDDPSRLRIDMPVLLVARTVDGGEEGRPRRTYEFRPEFAPSA